MPDGLIENLWSPATALKLFLVIASYPVWGRVLGALWRESTPAWDEEHPENVKGGYLVPRPHRPGKDPWTSIPRNRTGRAATTPSSGAPPPPERGAGRGAGRSAGRAAGRATAKATTAPPRRRGF